MEDSPAGLDLGPGPLWLAKKNRTALTKSDLPSSIPMQRAQMRIAEARESPVGTLRTIHGPDFTRFPVPEQALFEALVSRCVRTTVRTTVRTRGERNVIFL